MRLQRLSGSLPRKRAKTTIRVPGVRPASDLVGRDFAPSAPNQLWVADIKYIPTAAGWLYLAAVVDCFSRRVVGWSMRDDLRAELVVDALEMAVAHRRPGPGLIHHSDQGTQYVSLLFGERCRDADIDISMGCTSAYDNAVAESFFASLTKDLLLRRRERRGTRRRLRLHRDLLQPGQAPLHARLPVAGRLREDERRTARSRLTIRCPRKRGRSTSTATCTYSQPALRRRVPALSCSCRWNAKGRRRASACRRHARSGRASSRRRGRARPAGCARTGSAARVRAARAGPGQGGSRSRTPSRAASPASRRSPPPSSATGAASRSPRPAQAQPGWKHAAAPTSGPRAGDLPLGSAPPTSAHNAR
jgi:Integrase core domain